MAKWRKRETLGHALAREGKGITKSVARELLSIATLGFYKPPRRYPRTDRRKKW
jgi:hypothetical protein